MEGGSILRRADDWLDGRRIFARSPQRQEALELKRPTLNRIGHLVTPYFTSSIPWAQRHVETIELRSEVSARRRLTVDLVLPHDERCSLPWDDGRRLFYLPVTTIAKAPATSHIDLKDEEERNLPVLNRAQNAIISSIALRSAATHFLGAEPSRAARDALRAVCRETGEQAELAMAVALVRIGLLEFPDAPEKRWRELEALIKELAANSVLWLGVIGVPGERRIFQFAYEMDVMVPPLPRRRPRPRPIRVRIPDLGEFRYPYATPGDGNERSTVRRLLDRLTSAVGLSAFGVDFYSPYIHHTESYHLQIPAPNGIETRRIRLRAVLSRDSARAWPTGPPVTPTHAHLHFENVRVERPGTAGVSLRVGRRGFLSYSLLACALIAGMLWLFWKNFEAASADPGAAAPILLLVPALLAAFVVRPDEHALVARLMAGPRIMVFVCGTMSVFDALALVGILPLGLKIEEVWQITAIVATAVTGLLALVWLLALGLTEKARGRIRTFSRAYGRYAVAGAVLALIVNAMLFLVLTGPAGRDPGQIAAGSASVLVGALCLWMALFAGESRRPRYSRWTGLGLWLAAFAAAAGGLLYVDLGIGELSWETADRGLKLAAVAGFGVVVVTELCRRAGVPYGAPLEDEDLRRPGAMM